MYRILFADDEKDMVEIAQKRLIRDGYEVYPAFDGKDAYSKTVQYLPDLIISDVIMPGMNGFEFCKAVRNNTKTKDIPIIIITGNRAGLEDSFLFLGIKEFLLKPFEFASLEEKIKLQLGMAREMRTQKTKLLFHCVKEGKMSAARALIDSVPQWESKYVSTGRELIARAKEFIPDLIIIDLFMNDMSADEAIMCLRAIPQLDNTQILTYYSPISEGDDYIVQARMIEIQYLKAVTSAAGAREYLGPMNNPSNFISLFDDYRKDFST